MAYPRMHGWEHCIRDTCRTKKRVFGKSWNGQDTWMDGFLPAKHQLGCLRPSFVDNDEGSA